MGADRRGDAAGKSPEPAFTRGRVHGFAQDDWLQNTNCATKQRELKETRRAVV